MHVYVYVYVYVYVCVCVYVYVYLLLRPLRACHFNGFGASVCVHMCMSIHLYIYMYHVYCDGTLWEYGQLIDLTNLGIAHILLDPMLSVDEGCHEILPYQPILVFGNCTRGTPQKARP